MHLVHPSQWKDPYETRFIDAEYTGFMQDDNILNNIYCTCFNQSVISSEAHWNTYTNDHLCGRLVIDRGDLYEKLKKYLVDYDIYIAYIEYKKAYNGKGIERSLWGLLITQPSRMYRCVPVRINRGGEGKRGPTERVIKESAAYGKDKCK